VEEEEDHSRPKINPIERKLEIMGHLKKRVKIMKILVEKVFQEMRSDYSEKKHDNFKDYQKKMQSLKFLAKNLVTSDQEKKED
jgi:predicted solute-binding protein